MSNISELYPHNRKVFLSALENLKTHKKLGIVQATGTGKGKLAACFVEYLLNKKPSAKILVGAPFNSILQNYRDNFGISSKLVTLVNYKTLIGLSKNELINIGKSYDLIIVDEFHKLGAEMRNKAINNIFVGVDSLESNCRVIGFTATPIRYLDNARDMGEELFDGNIIEGINLEDAVIEEILPGFVYNACYFGTESVLEEIECKLKDKKYKLSNETVRNDLMVKVRDLNMIYHNRLKIENIIKENTKDLGVNQKWVIFCKNKENLIEIRKHCKYWFISKPTIYVIHSDRQSVDNDRTLKEFREANKGINVMLCVDMLNEGVHIKDLNGVIMLRKTDSPNIFIQQLGRALEAGKHSQPIIFDLIGNYRGLKFEEEKLLITPLSIVKGIEEKLEKIGKPNYVIVHNFTEDFDSFFSELSKYIKKTLVWTLEEDEIIKKYYLIGGYKLCQEKGILNKGSQDIANRAHALGCVTNKTFLKWTAEEDEIIKKYYLIDGVKGCIENGLNRNKVSIQKRAKILGVRRTTHWTEEEFELLRKYYPEGGASLCKEMGLNRPLQSILGHAKMEKIRVNDTSWSKEEEEILKKYFQIGSVPLCREKGINRTDASIRNRAAYLGLTRSKIWTDEEVEILNKYYSVGGTSLCQKMGLNKDARQIVHKAYRDGLRIGAPSWTSKEDSIIIKYYPVGGYKLCQEKGLNRSKDAIINRGHKFGLVAKEQKLWSDFEDGIIKKYYSLGGSVLCQEKGLKDRTLEAIRRRAQILNIKRMNS